MTGEFPNFIDFRTLVGHGAVGYWDKSPYIKQTWRYPSGCARWIATRGADATAEVAPYFAALAAALLQTLRDGRPIPPPQKILFDSLTDAERVTLDVALEAR